MESLMDSIFISIHILILITLLSLFFGTTMYILLVDLKRKTDIQALKDEMEIDALKKELNVYKRYNKEIPYTTVKERNIHPSSL